MGTATRLFVATERVVNRILMMCVITTTADMALPGSCRILSDVKWAAARIR